MNGRKIGIIGIVLVVIFITVPICFSYYSVKTYTVTVTDKNVKNSEDSSKYLVFTKTDNGTRVFSIEDSVLKWRFNSSDVYAEIEIGKTYDIEVIGWRIPFLSEYENIMKLSEVSEEN